MFPDELLTVLNKYKGKNYVYIERIYSNFLEVIDCLDEIKRNMISELSGNLSSDNIDRMQQNTELMEDIQILKEQIAYIRSFTCKHEQDEENEILNNLEETPDSKNEKSETDEKQKLYLLIGNRCPECDVPIVSHTIQYTRRNGSLIENEFRDMYECQNCHKQFFLSSDLDSFDFSGTNLILNETYYKQVGFSDLIVLSTSRMCTSANHHLKDITARIPILNSDGNVLFRNCTVAYCQDCNKYIMLKTDFSKLTTLGTIACKIIDNTTVAPLGKQDDFDIKQRESVLYQYGYNVKASAKLSVKQRHYILALVVETGIMTRMQIASHLATLIERGEKIPSWKFATEKWQQDREYIMNYKSKNLPKELFRKIILKYRKSEK